MYLSCSRCLSRDAAMKAELFTLVLWSVTFTAAIAILITDVFRYLKISQFHKSFPSPPISSYFCLFPPFSRLTTNECLICVHRLAFYWYFELDGIGFF